MLERNFLLNILIACILFVIVVKSFELPPHIRKCKPDDNACVSSLLSHLIQNGRDYPELFIPDLEHYQLRQTLTVQTGAHALLNFLSLTAHHSDVSLYGLNNFQMLEFSGFSLSSANTYLELLFPCVKFDANVNANFELLSLARVPFSGYSNATLTSVKVRLNLKTKVIQRNGDQYLQINGINSSIQILDDLIADTQLNTRVPEIILNVINKQRDSNWNQLKPLFETQSNKYLSEILYETITPIFEKVPINGFFL